MKSIAGVLLTLVLLVFAYVLQPPEDELHPEAVTDLAKPQQKTIQLVATVAQRYEFSDGLTVYTMWTPNNQEIQVYVDKKTKVDHEIGAERTYAITGTLFKPFKIQAKRLQLERSLPTPHDTIRIALDDDPVFDKKIGNWRYYHATLEGQPIQVVSQFGTPGRNPLGYFKGKGTFVFLQ